MRNNKKDRKSERASKKEILASVTEEIAPHRMAKSAREQEVNQNAPTAATDALTGLANYRRLSETIESEIKRSERTARNFAVLIFDLDGVQQINDSPDHLAAIGRLAAWPIFFASSVDRLILWRGMVATSLQLFCRRPAPKTPTRWDAEFPNAYPMIARTFCFL
jgi:Diguanylate cyclase, GGDEF domain